MIVCPQFLHCSLKSITLGITIMPEQCIFHIRNAFALYRVRNNTSGHIRTGLAECCSQLIVIIAILDRNNMPAESSPFFSQIQQIHYLRTITHCLHMIMVNNCR